MLLFKTYFTICLSPQLVGSACLSLNYQTEDNFPPPTVTKGGKTSSFINSKINLFNISCEQYFDNVLI